MKNNLRGFFDVYSSFNSGAYSSVIFQNNFGDIIDVYETQILVFNEL